MGFLSSLFKSKNEIVNTELFNSFSENYIGEEGFQIYCENFGQPIEEINEDLLDELKILLENPEYYNESGMTLKDNIQEYLINYDMARYLLINDYLDKLVLKHKQLVYVDDYGDLEDSGFENAISSFYKKRKSDIASFIFSHDTFKLYSSDVMNSIIGESGNYDDWIMVHMKLVVERYIENNDTQTNSDVNLDSVDDPYEYERQVANELCKLGWMANATKGSGDQGADVIAEKFNLKFIVQCKLYSKPVGNKAVQEVSSAKDYYEAFGAVVVTNQTYTKSAMQLAESQNVWLLHHSQLEYFSNLVEEIVLSDDPC